MIPGIPDWFVVLTLLTVVVLPISSWVFIGARYLYKWLENNIKKD